MMKTNVQVKDEPVEFQVEKLLRLYAYQSSTKTARMKTSEQEPSTCAWCQKLGGRSFSLQTESGETKTLCSEVCFNQYRRASFKKNKGSEVDGEQTVSITKNKSSEKKKREQQIVESNRRKIFIPHRHLTPSNVKAKPTDTPRSFSPPSSSSKRQRSSTPPLSNGKILRTDQTSLTPSNLPVSLTWQPSLLLPPTIPWSSPIDINRFAYPFLAPPPPPPPPPSALPITPSNLFTTLSKSTSSNVTCILPTFIPLPIPIPIPLSLPCSKCSVEVKDEQSQTISENYRPSRRLSL